MNSIYSEISYFYQGLGYIGWFLDAFLTYWVDKMIEDFGSEVMQAKKG
jgi:hypothetical protein